MKLRNIFDRKRVTSNPGTPEKVIYGSQVLKNGRIATFEKGKDDFYSYIQSFAESVDINKTIQKFINGDINALNQRKGEFIDCTQFPTNYAEVLNVINNATNQFNSLPLEVRAQFNFNLNEFIASLGSEKYNHALGIVNKVEITDEIINSATPAPATPAPATQAPATQAPATPAPATPVINKEVLI